MNGLPYYKRYPRDFLDGTVGMPFEEKTAYAFLLDLIYIHAGRLPDEPRFIAGQLGCSVKKWNIIREALLRRGKIVCRNGAIENFRAIIELESLRKIQDNSKNAARSRWEKNAENERQSNFNNDLANAPASAPHMQADMPERCHTESDTDKEEEGACTREAEFFRNLRKAVGLEPDQPVPRYWQDAAIGTWAERWRQAGLSDPQILEEAKASRAKNPDAPNGPKALDAWMLQAAQNRAAASAPLPEAKAPAPAKAPMSAEKRLQFFADLINGPGHVPASMVTNTMRDALLAAGMVTPEKFKERGIR